MIKIPIKDNLKAMSRWLNPKKEEKKEEDITLPSVYYPDPPPEWAALSANINNAAPKDYSNALQLSAYDIGMTGTSAATYIGAGTFTTATTSSSTGSIINVTVGGIENLSLYGGKVTVQIQPYNGSHAVNIHLALGDWSLGRSLMVQTREGIVEAVVRELLNLSKDVPHVKKILSGTDVF